jgi:cytochrome o ubiquinol oxidase subunit 2
MTTQLNLAASRTGDFNGFSGNISGAGFAGMAFTASAVPQDVFDEWVAQVQASSTPLSEHSYQALAAPSEYNPVAYYAPVTPDLFNWIQEKYAEPGSDMAAMLEGTGMDAVAPASTSTTDEPDHMLGSMDMTP